ncbi:hypothetical protein [Streptococcus porci]|nr:hypothetical protein [Streptococcus porci]
MSTTSTHTTILNHVNKKQISHNREVHHNKPLHPTTKSQKASSYHNRGNR